MSHRIRWADDPGGKQPMLKIEHACHRIVKQFIVLSDEPCGVFGHWDEQQNRNVPCRDPFELCICRTRSVSCWWRAYIGVLDAQQKVRIAELSKDAWLAVRGESVLRSRGTLRGLVLTLDRKPRVKDGAVVAAFPSVACLPDNEGLPPPPVLRDELHRIWFSRL